MLDPLIIAKNKQLIVCRKSFFDGIGLLDEVNNKMSINVDSDGTCNFEWIIDFNGLYYKLNKIGESKETFLTKIGWDRKQFVFNIERPIETTCRMLKGVLSEFSDEFSDIQNVSDLLFLLDNLKDDHVISTDDLKIYHNEE